MKSLKEKMKKQGGFTLVEMLIVVAIIAILVAVSIPLVNSSLDKAGQATDAANLRAAKAVATVELLENGSLTGKYYDLEKGELTTDTQTKQGKSSANSAKHIEATVDASNVLTVQWVAD